MLDYILAVSDPLAWHKSNIKQNPAHYSMSGRICLPLLQRTAAGIYYNTHIPVHNEPGLLIKYGVVGLDTLVDVCVFWNVSDF
jgi:translocator assembly and maintenance protein 41